MELHKPAILVLDALSGTQKKLRELNTIETSFGSFGSPYSVPQGSGACVLDFDSVKLLNYKEADGYIVDLRALPLLNGRNITRPADGVKRIFTSGLNGSVDPRPYVMASLQDDTERVLSRGGLLVVFARPLEVKSYSSAYLQYGGQSIKVVTTDNSTNYHFSRTLLNGLTIKDDAGVEMSPVYSDTPLSQLLSKHLDGGSFSCTFEDNSGWRNWTSLATNKFGECVAAYRLLNDAGALAILLPAVADEATFVASLFQEVLPDLCPKLFPNSQRGAWSLVPPYEMDSVIDLQAESVRVQEAAAHKVAEIGKRIAQQRQSNAFLFDLVRSTGTPLVLAVKVALAQLGFTKTIDIDEQMKAEGKDRDYREDLQIADRTPLLTVDVKGLVNFPADSDALQASKHASIRMQEYQRLDVRALAIINHQRNIPPLDRDNDKPFRDELLKVAAQVQMGMLTCWDLHRLVRNKKKWGWSDEHVIPVLYRSGRISPIPMHYSVLGVVEHYYEKVHVVSLRLSAELRPQQKISFELPIEFYEHNVDAIQIDRKVVAEASAGSLCGVVTPLERNQLKIGTRVYLVGG